MRSKCSNLFAAWMLDGKLIADKALERTVKDMQRVTFKSKGTHLVTFLATVSVSGDFRKMTRSINVN